MLNYPNYQGFTPQQNYGYAGYQQMQQAMQQRPMQQPVQQPPQQPLTNKLYVVSVDDALQRYAEPNTVMHYVMQDESAVIDVMTDPQGRKSHSVFKIVRETQNDQVEYATVDQFRTLEEKVNSLLKKESGNE